MPMLPSLLPERSFCQALPPPADPYRHFTTTPFSRTPHVVALLWLRRFQTPHRLPMSLCSILPKLPSSSRLETRCWVHLSYAPWRPPLNDSSSAPCDALLNALLNIPPADAQLERAFLDALVWSTPTETQSWAHVWTPVKLGCICRSSAEVYRSSL